MKWFRHETVAHTNLKLQAVVDMFGMEGYGYYWTCLELVGLQGANYRLKGEKNWKIYLKKQTAVPIERQDTFLNFFADQNLINKKALENGDLFLPKMVDYSDEYTKKRRRVSGQDTDNIPLQDNTNNTIHNNTNKTPYGEFQRVQLKEEEYKKLEEKLGEKGLQVLIGDLDRYIESKGKDKYRSHYAVIQTWANRRANEFAQKKALKTKQFVT